MRKKLLLITILVLLVGTLLTLSSCGNKYHAKILREEEYMFSENFIENHLPKGVLVDARGRIVSFETKENPEDYTYSIHSWQEAEEFFCVFTGAIDFEKEMLLVYVFKSISREEKNLKDVKLQSGVLTIRYEYRHSKDAIADNATSPRQNFLVLKIDKITFEKVEFIK